MGVDRSALKSKKVCLIGGLEESNPNKRVDIGPHIVVCYFSQKWSKLSDVEIRGIETKITLRLRLLGLLGPNK